MVLYHINYGYRLFEQRVHKRWNTSITSNNNLSSSINCNFHFENIELNNSPPTHNCWMRGIFDIKCKGIATLLFLVMFLQLLSLSLCLSHSLFFSY